MASYNERKLSVLKALEDLEEARASEIAEYLDISYIAARKALSRYYWQGLLHRRKWVYSISERGRERVDYLRESTS
jgi:Mn-dependent DtxR family transcriptional regulator